MDLKKMKNIGIVIVFSAIGLLINTNIVTAQNGNKADAVYEMQKIILSDEADDLNGTDEQKYSDGSDYNGNYLEGKREGQGIYTFDNGDYYDGQWKNDLMSGGIIDIGSDNGWMYIDNTYDDAENLDCERLFEVNFDVGKDNSNGLGLYIVRNILLSYGIEHKLERREKSIRFTIKIN